MTMLDHALTYAARGWRVHPLRPSAAPYLEAWQNKATTNPDTITTWWTSHPDAGIGIATGRDSGIWVLDIDTDRRRGKTGDETLVELEDAYSPLPDTYEVITGSGGRHLYFAWDPAHEIRNIQSGQLGADIDIRGEGGYVVAPPTPHRLYTTPFQIELGAADHPAPAPDWLYALLARPDTDHHIRLPSAAAGTRPGDLWAATVTWDQLLTDNGWTKLRPGPTGEDRWARPGKDPREGPSATVGYKGSDVLKVFTSSHPHLRAEETYTKLGFLAATRFDGNLAAAASWCRAQGFHAPRPADTITIVGARQAIANAPWPDPDPWTEPATPPPFPLHTLPTWTVDHVQAAAEARQVPVDLCAMLTIGALSAAATGRATVWPAPGWEEPVNLYLVVAMRSGAGKSPAEKAMVGWLRRWERERITAQADAYEAADLTARTAEKRYRKALDAAIAPDEDIASLARIAKAAREKVPVVPRLIIDDTTPEAVAVLLAAHEERLAILSTEADLFDMLLKGNASQRASMNVYLKAWSGDELRRDRKGGQDTGPEGTFLIRPLLTTSVTVQPAVLARVLTDPEMVSRGFAARFMFSMPDDLMGHRDQRRRFRAGDLATADTYETTARALATRWATWGRPADITLTPEAATALEEFLVELEPQLALGAALELLAEWVAKLTGSVARYAGLLHLAEHNDAATPVPETTMTRAIDLGRYWLGHAIAVAGSAEDDTTRRARLLAEWIGTHGAGQITLSELQAGCRRPGEGLDKVTDYIDPVTLLIERGWLRWEGPGDWRAAVGVRRAASPAFAVLPDLLGSSTDDVLAAIRVNRVNPHSELRNAPEPPHTASYPRSPRTASKGESFSPSLSPTPPTSRATRYADCADNAEGESDSPPVDNPGWSIFANPMNAATKEHTP
jgi:hypothetical protein